MRAHSKTLEELLASLGVILGYDEDGDKGGDGGDSDDDSETEEEEDETEEEEEEEDEEGKGDNAEAKALRAALKKERTESRKNARELKKLQKERDRAKGAKDDEAGQLRKDAEETKQTNVRLAARLKDQAVDAAISKHAGKLKFRDVDDALKLVERGDLDIDQDEEDPTDIEIDETTIVDALKKLAKSKPHLLLADGDEGPSGGRLGSRSSSKDELSEEALQAKYPALARGAHRK